MNQKTISTSLRDRSKRVMNTSHPIVHEIKEMIAERLSQGKEVIDFSQAILSFSPPPPVLEVLKNLDPNDPELHRLGRVGGLPELREAVAEYRKDAYCEKINAKNILITAGANHAFLLAIMTLADSDGTVALLEPYFFNHEMTIGLAGCNLVSAKLIDHDHGELEFKQHKAFTRPSFFTSSFDGGDQNWSNVDVLVVTNPNNPTGTYIEGLDRLEKMGKWLVVDESYLHFDYRREPRPTPHRFTLDHTLHIGSFSKSFSLGGWRVGYIIAHEKLIPELIKVQDATLIHPAVLSQKLALAALQDPKAHFGVILPELGRRREELLKGLKASGKFENIYGDGAVFLFVKLKGNGYDSDFQAMGLLDDLGIATVPCSTFGERGRGYLRFAYGMTDVEQIQRACTLMKDETNPNTRSGMKHL